MGNKPRIAIIGGGPAGLSAAYHLVRDPHWQDKIASITVYQLGWRLGGKGATGRDEKRGYRIEEHGIHGFCNFYFNTWHMMSHVYATLEATLSPDEHKRVPIHEIENAFLGSSSSYESQKFARGWKGDIVAMPFTEGEPWSKPPLHDDEPSAPPAVRLDWKAVLHGVIVQLLRRGRADDDGHGDLLPDDAAPSAGEGLAEKLKDAVVKTKAAAEKIANQIGATVDDVRVFHAFLRELDHKLLAVGDDTRLFQLLDEAADRLDASRGFVERILKLASDTGNAKLYRAVTRLDVFRGVFRGLVKKRFWEPDFDLDDDLDRQDFGEWLTANGTSPASLKSAFALGVPNILFAYPNGDCGDADDPKQPSLSAATWMNWVLRSVVGRGQYFYFMAAGTGETVISPLYLWLKKKGVTFEFFHKLVAIETGTDGQQKIVKTLKFERQAKTKTGLDYDPLAFPVPGTTFAAWPNRPLWDQLEGGHEHEESAIDFEDWQSKSVRGDDRVLTFRGEDPKQQSKDRGGFEYVIWAVPPSMVDKIADQPMKDEWTEDVCQLQTTATQAAQLWLNDGTKDLGWREDLQPKQTGRYASATFPNPLNGMAVFDDVIAKESWDANRPAPKGLVYLCAQFPDRKSAAPLADVRNNVGSTLGLLGSFLEKADAKKFGPTVPGSLLFGKIEDQYFRVNIRPTEAYVQSPPNSAKNRRDAWESGFANLVLAGDWIYTGLNAGSFEGAVTGGKLAAFALRGDHNFLDEIVGFGFFHPRARKRAGAAIGGPVPRIP